MSELKITDIIVKNGSREDMCKILSDKILKDKELFVETEGEGESLIARFKIGDGVTPYKQLPYISSIYKLFPNFKLYNNAYSYGIDIHLCDVKES